MTASELEVAVVNATPDKELTLDEWLTVKNGDSIATQLGGQLDPAAFMRAALSSIRLSSGLQKCFDTPQGRASLMGSIMLAAQLHLEIGPALGHFYLTPRQIGKDQERHWECVPIIGYRGYCELAYRTDRIRKIETVLIRKDDDLDMGMDSQRGRYFTHKPLDYEETRPWVGVIAGAETSNGGYVWKYLTKNQVLNRRPSHWAKGTPWVTNEEDMASKTGVRALAPYMPMTADLGRALQADERRVDLVEGHPELVVDETAGTVDDEPLDPEEKP